MKKYRVVSSVLPPAFGNCSSLDLWTKTDGHDEMWVLLTEQKLYFVAAKNTISCSISPCLPHQSSALQVVLWLHHWLGLEKWDSAVNSWM